MSATQDPSGQQGSPPTEEELRGAYEAEIKKIRLEHVLLEHVVTLVNLGMRRTGLAPGTEDERDPAQVRLAIEAIRAVLPLIEEAAPEQVSPIREALSQLQLAFVRIGGQEEGAAPPGSPPAASDKPTQDEAAEGESGQAPGPAQSSGRLWVPGQ
jgi:hypothetical protein